MARGIFGERLKRERELREVTQEEVTSATRISSRFLTALENEDWEKLPGGVFNRGFVRSIARYLGLDEEALLAEYDLARGTQRSPAFEHPEDRIPSPPRWIPVALLFGALAVLFALFVAGRFGWRYYQARRARTHSVAGSTPALRTDGAPAPSAAAAPATSFSSDVPLDLFVSASTPTHLRVLADGQLVFDTDIRPGENRHFAATDEFEVSADDSSAVLLELNGEAMPPLGLPGSSGTMKLTHADLRQAPSGNSQP